jgi:hypothetical protein
MQMIRLRSTYRLSILGKLRKDSTPKLIAHLNRIGFSLMT